MTPAELVAAGQAIWGDGWRKQMPIELGVSRQTVWKWESGKHPIPKSAERFLAHLAAIWKGEYRQNATGQGH